MQHSKPRQSKEQEQLRLDIGLSKGIEANFDGGRICSDGGILLLRKADEKLGLTDTAICCLKETRRPDALRHTHSEMFRQRMYGIAHLYEDCNDASVLRFDDMHKLAAGRLPEDSPLASQPTLSRFENSVDDVSLKALQQVLVHAYVRMHKNRLKAQRPKVVRLMMDTSCDPTHGYQQLSFYNGFYETDCYVPLFIFTDDGFPLVSLLRAGNAGPGEGALRMLKLVVENLRMAWPGIPIEISADAAFALPELYNYCEKNNVLYYFCIKGNHGLDYHTKELVVRCKAEYDALAIAPTGPLKHGKLDAKERKRAWRQHEERKRFSSKAEGRMQEEFEDQLNTVVKRFHEFFYDAREWPFKRRIIAKVEYTNKGPEVRHVVTNAKGSKARAIYEKYCQRCRCENWIKDLKNYLKCDRTSCQEFNANQFRLLLHTFAYALLWEVKRAAGLENLTVETVRLRLLKIGVFVKDGARKVHLSLASQHPYREEFVKAWHALESSA
jgi:hypothetical protein